MVAQRRPISLEGHRAYRAQSVEVAAGRAMSADLGTGALRRHIGSLYGAAVLDQPRELHPRNRVLGLARNFAGGRGRRLPGANFRETPLSESVQSMARRKRR
jgi:hypothetical protein